MRRRFFSSGLKLLLLFTTLLFSILLPVAIANDQLDHRAAPIIDFGSGNDEDANADGFSNLREGRRLFQLGLYNDASAYLWRAVLLHSSQSSRTSDNKKYQVDDAFTPFLQCYMHLNRVVDGLVFIAAESYLRRQTSMGELYLSTALKKDHEHAAALVLQQIVSSREQNYDDNHLHSAIASARIIEIRDSVDASLAMNNKGIIIGKDDFLVEDILKENTSKLSILSSDIAQKHISDTPEEIYNIGTYHFNTKNLVQAEQLFELSCIKSQMNLAVACTNAVYLRTNLCLWGVNGTGFERDMEIVRRVTSAEVKLFRSVRYLRDNHEEEEEEEDDNNGEVNKYYNDDEAGKTTRRNAGISILKDDNQYIYWNRATSVHPHMMLGYPLGSIDGDDAILLKRYVAESMAGLDELRARINNDGSIRDKPADLPYSVKKMREKFIKKHHDYEKEQKSLLSSGSSSKKLSPPIKVGFVACGFNSKAVLYLSHDMFRFFDTDIVEVHVFSTGQPDHRQFIQGTMRGVDWRQRVIDNVDYFHDVREYQDDHVGLARYIHNLEIQILIEWDGYARQGERAAGLMALRPAPIQILHQEFLMTSGAQYIDYIITDKVVSPQRLEGLYTEKFLWLPNHFFSKGHAMQKELLPPQLEYVPKQNGSQFQLGVGSPQQNACLSFNDEEVVSFVYCNFNKFLKHNPETVRSWIRILNEVPNSILCLLENPKEGIPNFRKFVTEASALSSNITDDNKLDLNTRIHFLSWEKNPFDHQRRSYSLCNVMLDSHPYNGHTTAQDALYAGVPIVTRSDGDDMSSRVSTSANVVLGLEELNAYHGFEEYENIAIRLGNDKVWFASIRTRLIKTCLQKNPMHPYWDVPRYVKNFQSGLTTIWSNFLSGKKIEHEEVTEDGEQGTTEAEVAAKEGKRKKTKEWRDKRKSEGDDHGEHREL